jgi:outer membrane protein
MKRLYLVLIVSFVTVPAALSAAQAPEKLTLQQAESLALENPALKAARLNALAAGQVTTEVRSSYFPDFQGNLTGADAPTGTRLAAGGLNNPSVFQRYSNGLTGSQLITDFGRTHHLVQNAQFNAEAENQNAETMRQSVLLQADSAYYSTLRAQAVLRVAQEAVKTRQILVDQTSALTQAKLKSELDLSFAKVSLGQAQLELEKASNDLQAAYANLSEVLGYPGVRQFDLVEQPAPAGPPPSIDDLAPDAMHRPDVQSQNFKWQAAQKFSAAERDLWFPSVSLVGAAGLTPWGDSIFRDRYAAAGFNVKIPVFEGFLFKARQNEARLKAEAEHQKLNDVQNRAERDLRIAWLNASTAYRRLDLSAQLLDQSSKALDLAQQRYKLGLSSIVELSQAQLNETQAEIDQAGAKYDYLALLSTLKYQAGLK